MADVIYKLYGQEAGDASPTNGVASVDIQDNGRIEAVYMDLWANGADALADYGNAELSFSSANSFGINDTRASIITGSLAQGFLTSGGGAMHKAVYAQVMIGINAGERLFLHMLATSGVTLNANVYIYATSRGGARNRLR